MWIFKCKKCIALQNLLSYWQSRAMAAETELEAAKNKLISVLWTEHALAHEMTKEDDGKADNN